MQRARLIAFYLPQFHPIEENSLWWGPGFTEWTNVAKARPLFPSHFQPRLPRDLGFYDLRVSEVRQAQADLARSAGIEGFCYWHYWFAGRRLLERPFDEVLESKEPDFPFCLAWANSSWKGTWYGASRNRLLIEQTYPGSEDHEKHFYALLPAFHDQRYIRVHRKPLFAIFQPSELPSNREFIKLWQSLALKNGLPGIHFVAHLNREDDYPWQAAGYDAGLIVDSLKVARQKTSKVACERLKEIRLVSLLSLHRSELIKVKNLAALVLHRFLWRVFRWPEFIYYYDDAIKHFSPKRQPLVQNVYPSVIPNWDNSARSGKNGVVLHNSSPALFSRHLCEVLEAVSHRPQEERIVFVKSWNEWAEGNYLEPDQRYGHGYLDAIRTAMASPLGAKRPYTSE